MTPAIAAAVLLAACSSAGPAIDDPREIITQGLDATAELTSVHLVLALDGTATIPELGGGEMSLDGTSVEGDVDIANGEGHLTFAVPSMLGLSGEIILVGQESYLKTTLTGPLWVKSTVSESDPVSGAMDPTQAIAEVRAFLDEEGVEVDKLSDTDCGDRTCYAVRLTIPAELLSDASAPGITDPAEMFGEALVLDLLFDRQDLWLTEVSTDLSAETVGSLTLRLTLSAFNEGISIEPPPADEVTEDGGQLFPF